MKAVVLLVAGLLVSAFGSTLAALLPLLPIETIVGGNRGTLLAVFLRYLGESLPTLGAVLFSLGVVLLGFGSGRADAWRRTLVTGIAVLAFAVALLLIAPPVSIWFPTFHGSSVNVSVQVVVTVLVTAMTPLGLTLIGASVVVRLRTPGGDRTSPRKNLAIPHRDEGKF